VKHSIRGYLALGALALTPLLSIAQQPAPGAGMFVVKQTDKSREAAVDAVKSYSEKMKWQYMGADKVKNGQVTLVKVCIPDVGKLLWPLGLQVSAMLPCGNLGIYTSKDKTEISMLHPSYMQLLYPNAEVEKAVVVATPLLLQMLDDVSK
jgi:hypothetical protein